MSGRWAWGIGLALALGLSAAVLTALDAGGQAVIWENAHWTLFNAAGLGLALYGVRTATGPERRVRAAIAVSSAVWLAAQTLWLALGISGVVLVPAPSDLVSLAAFAPAVVALDLAVRQQVDRRERLGLYLDGVITFLATATVMTLLGEHVVMGRDVFAAALLLSIPIAWLSLSGAGLIVALATRARPRHGGLYALIVGTFLLGAGYVPWVANAPAVAEPGAWSNYLFSLGAVLVGIGAATFRLDSRTAHSADRSVAFIRDAVPLIAVAVAVGCLVVMSVTDTPNPLVRPIGWSVIMTAVLRQVVLVRERSGAVRAAEGSAAAVRASEEQQRRIIETSSSAYVAINHEGIVVEWNERATETFGWTRDDAIGRSLSGLIVPEEQRAAHEAGLRRFAVTGSGPLVGRRVELMALDRSGRRFPVELSIWPVWVGGVLTFSALIHDITERRRLEDELRHQAFHDSLTGLANRALFSDRLDHALEQRGSPAVGVLYFDVDDFKLVNDGLGHSAGDGLLIQIAQRLGELLRGGDTAARLGGDEFAILLEHTNELDAINVAERIVESFHVPFEIAEHRVVARVSIGIAFGQPGSDAPSVLREADAAMYTAKRRGKGVWQVFDPSMAGHGLLEIELRTDLKYAIEHGGLAVAYQPIFELATRRTVGVEALARWTHPTRGVIPPSQFIPLAEAAELIVPLGRWVLQQACRTVQGWRASADGPDDLRLSVNISPRELLHGAIVEDVQAALADSGLDPASLTLEITEGVLVEEAGASLAALEGLKSLGVRIAIDDFGTGYSSLSYLSRLPIDVLKIDQSFVADIVTSRQAAALVRSILKIGQTLHLETIAEGVETEEQLDRLIRLGAKLGQGYLFARPLGANELPGQLLWSTGSLDPAV